MNDKPPTQPFGPLVSGPRSLTIEMRNLSESDLNFLAGLHSIFCDPRNAINLAALRAGKLLITRDASTGECVLKNVQVLEHMQRN